MFDTVRLRTQTYIDPTHFSGNNARPKDWVNRETGEVESTYQMQDELLPYIKYRERTGILRIELSIPKLLYGNNIVAVSERDIELFWGKLNLRMAQLFQVEISKDSWIVERVDVCCNFEVGDLVPEYVQGMSTKKLPRHNTILWNQCESVEFRNKESRIIVYDKQKECISNGESAAMVRLAKGVLRVEIRPSRHDMKKFSSDRRACDLLTAQFFEYVMGLNKVQSLFRFTKTLNPDFDHAWLQSQPIRRIETAIGFAKLLDVIGEVRLRELHNDRTFRSRKNMLQDMRTHRTQVLPDLCWNQRILT